MHQSTHLLFHLSNHPHTHPQPTHACVSSTHIFIHPYPSFPLSTFFPPFLLLGPLIHPSTRTPTNRSGHPPSFTIPPLSNILPDDTSSHHSTLPQPLTHFLPPVRPPTIRHLPSLPPPDLLPAQPPTHPLPHTHMPTHSLQPP